jgi:hypothetical protein
VTSTGWTLREAESLTLREANDLLDYWSTHPPAHLLLRALLQAKPLRKAGEDLASAVAAAGGGVKKMPPGLAEMMKK